MLAVSLLTAVLTASCLDPDALAHVVPVAGCAGFEDHRAFASGDDVQFVLRRGDTTTFLTSDALVVALHPLDAPGTSFALQFEGAHDDVVVVPLGAALGRVHHYRGDDRRENIATHAAVRYHGLYDGVDLRVYETAHGLEYDLELAPGADLEQVRIRCVGVDDVTRLAPDRVSLATAVDVLEQTIPASWTVSAEGERVPVEASFRVDAETLTLTFAVDDYDATRPLVIDPGLDYGSYLGGNLRDLGADIEVVPNGDVYVAGMASSANFPTTIGDPISGLADAFLARFDDDAGALVHATFLGGNDTNFLTQETAVALGVFGSDVYLTGRASSSDFPTTTGVVQPTRPGSADAFVARFASDGALVWSTYVGGTGEDRPRAMSVNASGHVAITGFTSSDDFPTTPAAFSDEKSAIFVFTDAFVTVLSADGTAFVASSYYGGTLRDEAYGVHLADDGVVTIGGLTSSSDLPTSVGAFDETYNGASGTQRDAFVARFDAAVSTLIFGTYIGGPDLEEILAIDVEPSGAIVAAGVARDDNFPTTPGALQTTFAGGDSDAFALRLSADGTTLEWSTYFGGSDDEEATGVAAQPGATGAVTFAGWTESTDIPLGGGTADPVGGAGSDGFVARLAPGGAALLFSSYHGGEGDDSIGGLDLDDLGTAWVTGETTSTLLPLAGTPFDSTNGGSGDAFVARFGIAPWVDIGFAKVGTNGLAPRLIGTGTLVANEPGQLVVRDAPPSAPSILFVGLAAGNVPFKGGTLVPLPIALSLSLGTFPDGSLTLPFLWPTGIPAGFPFYFQFWSSDPGVQGNVAATNGVEGIAG